MTSSARILLVDDHPIIRLGVRQLLHDLSDLVVCGEADSVDSGLDAVAILKPDLVIADLSLGGEDGLELIRRLRVLDPALPIVVFSLFEEALYAELAFNAGARAYVMKHEPPARLIYAIRDALKPPGPT